MLYASTAKTAIRLKHDGDKCEFMEQLNSLTRDLSGSTNTYAGKFTKAQYRGDGVRTGHRESRDKYILRSYGFFENL